MRNEKKEKKKIRYIRKKGENAKNRNKGKNKPTETSRIVEQPDSSLNYKKKKTFPV